MLNNIEAVIFDLDGTIVDSMWVWEKIDVDYLKLKGFEVPDDLRDDIAHLSFNETALYFKNRFRLSDTLEEIQGVWNEMALTEYSYNIKLKPGAKEFLEFLRSKGIKIILATSNSTLLLELVLKNNGVFHLFDSITTTSEVKKGKDCPDVYLLAATKLGIPPEHCLVFEDILPAVLAAKAAGMRVIGVKDNAASHQWEAISESAELLIKDFNQLMSAV